MCSTMYECVVYAFTGEGECASVEAAIESFELLVHRLLQWMMNSTIFIMEYAWRLAGCDTHLREGSAPALIAISLGAFLTAYWAIVRILDENESRRMRERVAQSMKKR